MYLPACTFQRLAELQNPGTGRREAGCVWWAVFGRWHEECGVWHMAWGVWCPKSWHQLLTSFECYFFCFHCDKISWCLMVMVLTIVALVSAGTIEHSNLGRADLQLRCFSRDCCVHRIDCGCMCVHSVWCWWRSWLWQWQWQWQWR